MNTSKKLIFIVSILASFNSILHAMLEESEELNSLKKDIESLTQSKQNQRFTAFSEHLKNYNINEQLIKEFKEQPYNSFQDSIPYIYCQPSFFTTSSKFIQKAFLGSSVEEIKNAWRALTLIKTFSDYNLENIIEGTFLENQIPSEMKIKNLGVPKNSNITVLEKNLYTENDDLSKNFPDKVSFTIGPKSINYTIEMNSVLNELDPGHIPNRLAKTCAIIEKGTLIIRPLRALFFNTLLIAPNVLLPFAKLFYLIAKIKIVSRWLLLDA